MGFIRGTAITFFSFVLLISLFLIALTLTVSWSLEYETLQPALKTSASEFLQSSFNIEDMFSGQEEFMQSACLIQDKYKFSEEGYTFEIPCEIIEQGKDSIINYGVGSLIKDVYYSEYNCEFWSCLKNSSTPLVLFSEKAMDYWKAKFILLAVLSLIIFALIFLISKNRPTTVLITGILIILASLPFRRLDWLLTFIPGEFSGLFSVFFTKSNTVFTILLIIGVVFVGVGLVFKFFGLSMRLSKDSSEEDEKKEGISKSEVREIVKEEMTKKNISKSKQKK